MPSTDACLISSSTESSDCNLGMSSSFESEGKVNGVPSLLCSLAIVLIPTVTRRQLKLDGTQGSLRADQGQIRTHQPNLDDM
jgi:hypothetical protein